jgi:integrase
MPSYLDKATKKWYCKFNYKDYLGNTVQKKKSGFKLKREADKWERDFLAKNKNDVNIPFDSFCEKYFEFYKTRVKESSYNTQFILASNNILPYFKNIPLSKIDSIFLKDYQTYLLNKKTKQGKPFSKKQIRNVWALLNTILNHAVKYYGLPENPCSKVDSIGSQKAEKKMTIWTLEQFESFLDTQEDFTYYALFSTLYYTGMRKGELLALTWDDIDLEKKTISITKTLALYGKNEIVQTPKTPKGNRVITIFDNLAQILKEYKAGYYKPDPSDCVFCVSHTSIYRRLCSGAEQAGLPKIRIHDLRHSHASLLVNMGMNPLAIAERLGHEDVAMTLNIYSHLYPDEADLIAEKLQEKSQFLKSRTLIVPNKLN